MKLEPIENVVIDEAHGRTYAVMADHVLTDGELYRAIRIEILRRGGPPAQGERLVISHSRPSKTKGRPEAPPQPVSSNAGRGELK